MARLGRGVRSEHDLQDVQRVLGGEHRGGAPEQAIDEVGHPSDERATIWRCERRLHLEPDHVARPDLLDGAAFALRPAAARRHDQRLAERVSMPGRPSTRLEGDAGARTRAGASNSGSIRTPPVNHSADPRLEGREPFRMTFIVASFLPRMVARQGRTAPLLALPLARAPGPVARPTCRLVSPARR